jgi:tetratricopeptide (TPR) repeat protein
VAAFRQAQALEPTRYEYAMALATTLEQLRQYEEALALFEAVASAYPDIAEVAHFQAKCLVSMRRYADAVAVLERARVDEPLPPWAVRELAFAYSQLHRQDAAIAAEEEVVQRVPHDVSTLYDLQSSYRRVGRYADAYRVVRQILTLQPDHPGALRVLPYLKRNLPR